MKFIIGVLVHKTLCFVFKSCNRTVWPPLRQVTIFVKQSTYRNEMKTNLGSTNLNKISKSRSFFFVSSLLFGKCSKFNIISSVCFNFSEQENSFSFFLVIEEDSASNIIYGKYTSLPLSSKPWVISCPTTIPIPP